jgi:hypothetical protein
MTAQVIPWIYRPTNQGHGLARPNDVVAIWQHSMASALTRVRSGVLNRYFAVNPPVI